jgi:PAS domain-containing protein
LLSVQLVFLMGLVILIDTGLTFVHEVFVHQEFTYFTALHVVSIGLLLFCLFKVATISRLKLSRMLLRILGTRQRHAENKRLITSLYNDLPCAIAIVSPSFTLVGTNKEAQNLTGFKSDFLRGKKCYDVFGKGEICQNCPVQEAVACKQVCRNFKQELTQSDDEIYRANSDTDSS